MTALTHVTEKQWQLQVRELLALSHFELVHTVWNSRHSPSGWPDLCAIRRDNPGYTLAVLELKRESLQSRTTSAQRDWLGAWSGIAATVNDLTQNVRIITGVFRPSQADELAALLQERQP